MGTASVAGGVVLGGNEGVVIGGGEVTGFGACANGWVGEEVSATDVCSGTDTDVGLTGGLATGGAFWPQEIKRITDISETLPINRVIRLFIPCTSPWLSFG